MKNTRDHFSVRTLTLNQNFHRFSLTITGSALKMFENVARLALFSVMYKFPHVN